jgi:hypothetical protein
MQDRLRAFQTTLDARVQQQAEAGVPATTSPASIREQVFDCVAFSTGLTPDEIAGRLQLSILTVRPRCSELVRCGRLVNSGGRRANASGRLAKVLIVASGARSIAKAA